jgi:hypothetical protein
MAAIHDELLCAFWQNELTVFGSRGEAPVVDRLLRSVRLKSEYPGFTVVDSIEMIPGEQETSGRQHHRRCDEVRRPSIR